MLYRQYLSDFLSHLHFEKNYSSNTIIAYEYDISEFLLYLNKRDTKFDACSPGLISEWMEKLSSSNKSPRSLGRKISSLRMFSQFLLKRNKLSSNPFQSFRMPKAKKMLPKTLSQKEIMSLLDNLPSTDILEIRNKSILILLYSTGLRSEELCRLRCTDMSSDFSFLRILGKGKKERQIPLIDLSQSVLRDWITIKRQGLDKGHSDVIFLSKNGRALTTSMIRVIVDKITNNLSKKISPHVFRYTFATHLLEGNANLRHIQELLGHSSLSVTERYTQVSIKHLQESYQKFHPRA